MILLTIVQTKLKSNPQIFVFINCPDYGCIRSKFSALTLNYNQLNVPVLLILTIFVNLAKLLLFELMLLRYRNGLFFTNLLTNRIITHTVKQPTIKLGYNVAKKGKDRSNASKHY